MAAVLRNGGRLAVERRIGIGIVAGGPSRSFLCRRTLSNAQSGSSEVATARREQSQGLGRWQADRRQHGDASRPFGWHAYFHCEARSSAIAGANSSGERGQRLSGGGEIVVCC